MTENKRALVKLLHIKTELDFYAENGYIDRGIFRYLIDTYHCIVNDFCVVKGKNKGDANWKLRKWADTNTTTVSIGSQSLLAVNRAKAENETTLDHLIPIKHIINKLLELEDNSLEAISKVLDHSVFLITITSKEDKKLNSMGLRSKMPKGFGDADDILYQNPLARYIVAGIEVSEDFVDSFT